VFLKEMLALLQPTDATKEWAPASRKYEKLVGDKQSSLYCSTVNDEKIFLALVQVVDVI
jgi:hypothetical protein